MSLIQHTDQHQCRLRTWQACELSAVTNYHGQETHASLATETSFEDHTSPHLMGCTITPAGAFAASPHVRCAWAIASGALRTELPHC
jgi:hypothetical protein